MKIGIIGPTLREIMPFVNEISKSNTTEKAGLTFYEGIYDGLDLVLVCGGVGKVNTAIAVQLLIDSFHVTDVILTGVAGGIDGKLKIGDTVIGDEFVYHDMDMDLLKYNKPWDEIEFFKADKQLLNVSQKAVATNKLEKSVYCGRIVTGDQFITHEGRNEIIEKFKPLCVDMETAGAAHVCYANKIPFLAIRSLSDTAEESGFDIFEKNCEMVAKRSIEIVKLILKELIK